MVKRQITIIQSDNYFCDQNMLSLFHKCNGPLSLNIASIFRRQEAQRQCKRGTQGQTVTVICLRAEVFSTQPSSYSGILLAVADSSSLSFHIDI